MAETIAELLFAEQDLEYQAFQCKLMPTVDPARVIGVRMPALRALARRLKGTAQAQAFLQQLPHYYYEENNLHGLFLCAERDYQTTVAALDRFLPYVDNWATCDLLSPVAFRQHPPELPAQIQQWMASEHVYTVRFGVGCLLSGYLDAEFKPVYLEWAAALDREEYYINMMVAWYFATALAKQYDAVLPYLQQRRLPRWTHNKTIQKAVESRRISQEQKQALRALRWKE